MGTFLIQTLRPSETSSNPLKNVEEPKKSGLSSIACDEASLREHPSQGR
jgi:hypothetical protein